MPLKKREEKTQDKQEASGFYKGYDMRWLESEPTHPDYHLVAEYKKGGKK